MTVKGRNQKKGKQKLKNLLRVVTRCPICKMTVGRSMNRHLSNKPTCQREINQLASVHRETGDTIQTYACNNNVNHPPLLGIEPSSLDPLQDQNMDNVDPFNTTFNSDDMDEFVNTGQHDPHQLIINEATNNHNNDELSHGNDSSTDDFSCCSTQNLNMSSFLQPYLVTMNQNPNKLFLIQWNQ